MSYIKGNYKTSIYESNNYVIGLFKIKETNDDNLLDYINKTITFTGYFDELISDTNYIFNGNLITHPKYGLQYKVLTYEKIKPTDKDGIIEFLSSDLFKGIGVSLSTRIVNTLGVQALDLILEDKNILYNVDKISEKKINIIYDTLVKYNESHATIVYLTELGFTLKDALLIYNKYKGKTIEQIKYNIYSIIDDIKEIDFIKIDKIALETGIDLYDSNRIESLIYYIIKHLTFTNSDTYVYKEEIEKMLIKYLNSNISNINEYLESLEYKGKIIILDNKYYLEEMYNSELIISNKIKKILSNKKTKYKDIEKDIKKLEKINNIKYDISQKDAIISSLENNITIITGGPGVGKTTIIKAIVDLYIMLNNLDDDNSIKLLAPTGRASKRLSNASSKTSYTIHKFLKWDKEKDNFFINEYNKDYSKLIIIDEVSMIDTLLFANLLKGLTNDIKLVLVGDYNQLPSVLPGLVLKDLCDSNLIEVIKLEKIYRQNDNSYIPILAHEVNNNSLTSYLDKKEDYVFLKCNKDKIIPSLIDISSKIKEKTLDKKVQIIAPMYATNNGIDNLNKILQEVFNKKSDFKKEIVVGDIIYRVGDKIIELVNMPENNIYNGDIGIIEDIILFNESESNKNEIIVNYDGNLVKYLPKDFINIKHAYAISIHKSQGSEFDIVIMPICNDYKRMLYKKLIYTGITRAKEKLIIIGEESAFLYAVNNDKEIVRKTSLIDKLSNN